MRFINNISLLDIQSDTTRKTEQSRNHRPVILRSKQVKSVHQDFYSSYSSFLQKILQTNFFIYTRFLLADDLIFTLARKFLLFQRKGIFCPSSYSLISLAACFLYLLCLLASPAPNPITYPIPHTVFAFCPDAHQVFPPWKNLL